MTRLQSLLLAQEEYAQTEYGLGIALTIGLILLGVVLICVPRFRKPSIYELDKADKKKSKKKKTGKKKKR